MSKTTTVGGAYNQPPRESRFANYTCWQTVEGGPNVRIAGGSWPVPTANTPLEAAVAGCMDYLLAASRGAISYTIRLSDDAASVVATMRHTRSGSDEIHFLILPNR